MYKTIDQLTLSEKRVFIRVDYNVKMQNGRITDDTRIKETLPTLEYALSQKAKIILASHLGRPKGVRNEQYSLLPVAEHLSDLLKMDVIFPEDCVGDGIKKLATNLRDGEIMLLENLRFHPEEEQNAPQFAEKLAGLAEVYVNDAFGASHRAHASTVGMVSGFKEKGIGLLMKKEIDVLSKLLNNHDKPFLVILGGAKVSSKIDIISNLMQHANVFLIGGGMAYTFLKAMGKDVGKSLVEESKLHVAEKILKRAELKGIEFILPVDSVCAEKIETGAPTQVLTHDKPLGPLMGLDIGPKTLEKFQEKIAGGKVVFWNGPMGVFETPPFNAGTFAVAKAIAESKSMSVVGGGDSLAAVNLSGYEKNFTHLSTGGGASMEFLEGKVLPGLKALE